MTVTLKSKDGQAIRKLIPLTTLPESAFNKLCSQIRIEEGPKGTVLFKQGDQKNEFVYLLEGTISLQAAGMEMDTITGGSEEARFALAHQIPRKVFAVAKDKIRFIRISAEILNSTTLKQQRSVAYEVSDIPEESSDDWMTTLLKSPIFQRLPAANLQKVLTSVEEIEVKAGELVVKQGDPGDFYYIIKQGRCSLTRKPSKNAKEIKLAELKATDTFGEDSIISGAPRNVNVTMLTDGVLLRLSKENFLELIKKPVIETVSIEQALKEAENGAVLLDVRTPDGFEHGHLEGSRNIPFFSLRMQLGNLDPTKKLIVVCEDGNTSEAASFLLIRHALDAVILKGGFNAVPKQYFARFGRDCATPATVSSEEPSEEPSIAFSGEEINALDEARQIIAQLQSQLQSEREKRKSVEMGQGDSGAFTDQVRQNELELKKQIDVLNREFDAVKKEAREYRDRLAEAESKLINSTAAADKAIKESEDLKSEFTAKLEALESEVDRRQIELETAAKNSALDKERIEALSETLKDQEKRLRSLQESIAEKTAKLEKEVSARNVIEANLSRIQKETSKQIAQFGEQADKAKETVTELRRQLEQSRQSCALLKKQNAELIESQSGQVESLLAEKQAFEKEADELKQLAAQLMEEKQRMESGANRRIDQLQENLAKLEQQIEQQNQDLERTRNALHDRESQVRDLQDTIDRTAEKTAVDQQELQDNLQKEIALIKEELDESLREKENLREILNTAAEVKALLEDQFTSTRSELDNLQTSFSESEQVCLRLQQEKETFESEIERLKLESNARHANSEQWQKELLDRCQQSEADILDLRSRLENASLKEKQAAREVAELTTLNQNIERAAGERTSELESKIAELTRVVESKTGLIQSLQDELEKAQQSRKEFEDALDRLSANQETANFDAENQRNSLVNRIKELEEALDESNHQLNEARKLGQTLEADDSSTIEEIKKIKENQAELETQIAALTESLQLKDRDLEETRRAINLLTGERDGLDLRKRELETENASLQKDLDNLDGIHDQLAELESLAEQQREEIRRLNDNHALQILEVQERQSQLDDEIASLHAENSKLQEQVAEKTRDLTAMEEKLFAIRNEDAEPADTECVFEPDALHSEINRLKGQYDQALEEKDRVLNDLAGLRKANEDLESLVEKLATRAEHCPGDEAIEALKSELASVRSQAEREVQTVKRQFDQSQRTVDRLERELADERRRAAELEASTCQPLSLNPELTAVDGDVFEMIEEQTKPKKPEQPPSPPKPRAGKIIAACVLSATASLTGAFGFLLGTESGRNWLESVLRADSTIPIVSKSSLSVFTRRSVSDDSTIEKTR